MSASILDLVSSDEAFEVDLTQCSTNIQENIIYNCKANTSQNSIKSFQLSNENTCRFLSIDSSSGIISGKPSILDTGNCLLAVEAIGETNTFRQKRDLTILPLSPSLKNGILNDLRTNDVSYDIINSPDNLKIGIKVTDELGFQSLFCVNTDGTGFTRIGNFNDFIIAFKFNSFSNKIYFSTSSGKIFSSNTEGSELTRVNLANESVNIFDVIPGTDYIVYFNSANSQLIKAKYDGTNHTNLLSQNIGSNSGSFSLSIVNGTHAIFLASKNFNNQLYSVPLDGSGEILLHSVPVANGGVSDFLITPDQQKVVFRGDLEVDQKPELYVANIDGSGKLKLNGPLSSINSLGEEFAISSDSNKVIYTAKLDSPTNFDLYVVNIDGSNQVKLTPTLGAGKNVSIGLFYNCNHSNSGLCNFRFTPDNTKVVYTSNQDTSTITELYVVNVDGTANTKISGSSVSGGKVNSGFLITADSQYVIFTGDLITDNINELFSVKIDGTQLLKLNLPTTTGIGYTRPFILSNSGNNLYAELSESSTVMYQSLSIDFITGARNIFLTGEGTRTFNSILSMDRQRVYSLELAQGGLKLVQFDFATNTQKLVINIPHNYFNDNLIKQNFGFNYQNFIFDDTFDNIYYTNLSTINFGSWLKRYSFIDSTNSSLANSASVIFLSTISPLQTRIFFISSFILKSIDLDGNNSVTLNQRTNGYGVSNIQVLSNGNVVIKNQEVSFIDELFTNTPSGNGYTRVNSIINSSSNRVSFFKVTPDESKIVYRSAEDGNDSLRVVNIDNTSKRVLATTGSSSTQVTISPDSTKVAWAQYGCCSISPIIQVTSLTSITTPWVLGNLLNNSSSMGIKFTWTPDSTRIVVLSDLENTGKRELFIAPITTGGVHTKISIPIISDGGVSEFLLSDNGQWVIYLADAEVRNQFELYAYKIDGSYSGKISGDITKNGSITTNDFKIDSNNDYVIFTVGKNNLLFRELYSVNLNTFSINKLNQTPNPKSQGVSKFEISSSGRVFYVSDESTPYIKSLFSVSLNGTGSVKLDSYSKLGSGVSYFKINPTGNKGFFIGYKNALDGFEINQFSY